MGEDRPAATRTTARDGRRALVRVRLADLMTWVLGAAIAAAVCREARPANWFAPELDVARILGLGAAILAIFAWIGLFRQAVALGWQGSRDAGARMGRRRCVAARGAGAAGGVAGRRGGIAGGRRVGRRLVESPDGAAPTFAPGREPGAGRHPHGPGAREGRGPGAAAEASRAVGRLGGRGGGDVRDDPGVHPVPRPARDERGP